MTCEFTTILPPLTRFLSTYRWWLDGFHLLDFFTHDLWSQVDAEWRDTVGASGDEFMDQLLDVVEGHDIPEAWPSSIRQFILDARQLPLSRRVEEDRDLAIQTLTPDRYNLESCRLAAMSMKKLHEVDRLSRVVSHVARQQSADSIIDVGAGHGYLTHLVARQNGSRRVYAVDCEEDRTCGSKDRGKRVLGGIHHDRIPEFLLEGSDAVDDGMNEPVYVTAMLDPKTLPQVLEGAGKRFVLIGLHSCGDLSGVTMLRTFLECEEVKAVVIVGCCYHRVTVEGDSAGFPLSSHVGGLLNEYTPPLQLSYRSLTLACLTFASFRDRSAIRSALRGHYHRAMLELVLQQYEPARQLSEAQKLRVGSLPKAAMNDLASYVVAACRKLGICDISEQEDALRQLVRSLEVDRVGCMKRIAFMSIMRSILGPCVESLVLLDRVAYLRERLSIPLDAERDEATGRSAVLRNLFDYAVSPRNMVVVAEKA
ncbi:hypothetical protein HDU85_004848 [Gaertneriomyces sp. JEL0708]|nr:hypothetical protein HDU85_004848 [Gaertneriomyces sp. JEL0708]